MPIILKVKDVMDDNVHLIDGDTTVDGAIKLMVENNVWSLIVEMKGRPEGVVTERDIIRRCLSKGMTPSGTSVRSIASSPVLSISPEASIREAMDLMAAKEVRRLFVIDQGKIIGRVTQTGLFKSTLSVMETLTSLSGQL